METIKKAVFEYYNNEGIYPKNIKLNKNIIVNLKERGYVSSSPTNPSKLVFLGIEVQPDDQVRDFEIC
ncbi:hypothetical protein [Bacillus massiliigorillae]|uniref:hypothetical protein n=1 Tax=Bacillus massiliigorillae TaxID=1243664 RepID=UPI00039C6795|nr:hypothetical protein [Bacillus massiliigorillae]